MFDAWNAIRTLCLCTWQDRLRTLIGVAYMRLTHAATGNVNDRSSDTRIAPGLRSQNARGRVEFPDFVNDIVAASIMK